MTLNDYIQKIGRKKAAALFGVSEGSISHWITGRRKPSPDTAKVITSKSPVTWKGIYEDQKGASHD